MDLFGTKRKKLEQELRNTKKELEKCNCKLLEKQEHINKTNAYWKKKLRDSRSLKTDDSF